MLSECNALTRDEWQRHVSLWKHVRLTPRAQSHAAQSHAAQSCFQHACQLICAIRPPQLTPFQEDTRSLSVCHKLSEAFGTSRTLLRDVGVAAQVPIEPAEQTKVIDATVQVS